MKDINILPELIRLDEKIKYECTKCGICCNLPVIIFPTDNKIFYNYIDFRIDDLENERTIEIMSHGDGACKFQCENKCSVYESRPHVCSSYPFYLINNEVYYDTKCPGIGNGNEMNVCTIREWCIDRKYRISDTTLAALLYAIFGNDDYLKTYNSLTIRSEILKDSCGANY